MFQSFSFSFKRQANVTWHQVNLVKPVPSYLFLSFLLKGAIGKVVSCPLFTTTRSQSCLVSFFFYLTGQKCGLWQLSNSKSNVMGARERERDGWTSHSYGYLHNSVWTLWRRRSGLTDRTRQDRWTQELENLSSSLSSSSLLLMSITRRVMIARRRRRKGEANVPLVIQLRDYAFNVNLERVGAQYQATYDWQPNKARQGKAVRCNQGRG